MRGAGAFLCTTNRGKLLQHKLIHVQCTKKNNTEIGVTSASIKTL